MPKCKGSDSKDEIFVSSGNPAAARAPSEGHNNERKIRHEQASERASEAGSEAAAMMPKEGSG